MAGLWRKILPVVPLSPKRDDDDANNMEYSIAMEYSGPPVDNIPRILPIIFDQIPIAAKVASPLNDISLPVIQPVGKKRPKGPKLSSKHTVCKNSLTNFGASSKGHNVSCESPTCVDSCSECQRTTGYDRRPISSDAIVNSRNLESTECQDNSYEILDRANGDECMCKLSDGIGVCDKLNSPNCHENSCVIEKFPDSSKKGAELGFENFVNPANFESTESGSTSCEHSSHVVSCKEEYCNHEETPFHVKGTSSVTSNDPETIDVVREEYDGSGAESIDVRPEARRHGKKVSCCPCLKENRSNEMKCIVCDARYCCKCVLTTMGSTTEGRKCVACTGFRIDEGMSMSDRTGSSGELKGPDCPENAHVTVGLPDDNNEGAGERFQDYMNPASSESTTESGLSSQGDPSSEVFSCKEEDCNKEGTPCHVKRPSVVTFRDPETTDVVQEESEYPEVESFQNKPKAERPGKRGSCYRCLKGNRFTEKEVCIVCGAKFCCNCVLRAMGSMPEGRKCVTCIGFRVDDAKRRTLGKCSRMLKRLLTEMEIKQIMRSEISCEANQLPPERVFVNDEPLSQKELVILQSCANPPIKLNPGSYWYDKVSGLWGKIGQPPCQFICPQLSVGGQIMKHASNGNTNVCINNREITTKELWMLQLAGVQCEGKPHFWVSADGSYQEEGMKNVKGRIWDKTRAKLVCSLLSLPTPPDSMNPCGDEVDGVKFCKQKVFCKFLLLGGEKSGTSTIYNQAKLLFGVPFSEDERQNIKFIIQSNLYRYLGILLEGRERFEEESLIDKRKRQVIDEPGPSGQIDSKTLYTVGPKLKAFSDWLLKVMASGNLEVIFPAATREYAPFIEELWKDAAFQATYNRRNELDVLPRVATYFLERAVEISRTIYEPSDLDILYAEGSTSRNGLSCMEFSFPKSPLENSVDSSDQNDFLLRYQLIRVHPRSLGGNCKWVEMFEEVDIVLFSVSLTEYDEYFEDSNGVLVNKMLASRQLFERVATHPTFGEKNFLLLLNKYDLLEENVEQVPLTRCEWFHDFNPVISHNPHRSSRRNGSTSLAQYAFHYIAVKFKRLFKTLTDRKLFVAPITALEQDSVDGALKYAREILKWDEEEPTYSNVIESCTDFEASTSS